MKKIVVALFIALFAMAIATPESADAAFPWLGTVETCAVSSPITVGDITYIPCL